MNVGLFLSEKIKQNTSVPVVPIYTIPKGVKCADSLAIGHCCSPLGIFLGPSCLPGGSVRMQNQCYSINFYFSVLLFCFCHT